MAQGFGELGGEYVVRDQLFHVRVGCLSGCARLAQKNEDRALRMGMDVAV